MYRIIGQRNCEFLELYLEFWVVPAVQRWLIDFLRDSWTFKCSIRCCPFTAFRTTRPFSPRCCWTMCCWMLSSKSSAAGIFFYITPKPTWNRPIKDRLSPCTRSFWDSLWFFGTLWDCFCFEWESSFSWGLFYYFFFLQFLKVVTDSRDSNF